MGEAVHGGTDAQGVPAHDFSSNRNACGPCPAAVAALQVAHVAQYPDPHYTDVCAQLAAFHGVAVHRIVIGGSSSELIHRLTQHAVRSGARGISLPQYHYGDYAQAARVWALPQRPRGKEGGGAALHWACEPSSPLGGREGIWPLWAQACSVDGRLQNGQQAEHMQWRVLDCAYRPLWLEGVAPEHDLNALWQLWTPNKALGMTGVRAAYAIAPVETSLRELRAVRELAASWVVGAHGVAMLQAWVTGEVQHWLAHSLQTLRGWKPLQLALCQRLGWQVIDGHMANYFVARLPLAPPAMAHALQTLRSQGVKLRDCASFGLPGHVRLGVLAPASQAALEYAWNTLEKPQ